MILLTVFDAPLTSKTTAQIYYYEADSALSTIKILLLVLIRKPSPFRQDYQVCCRPTSGCTVYLYWWLFKTISSPQLLTKPAVTTLIRTHVLYAGHSVLAAKQFRIILLLIRSTKHPQGSWMWTICLGSRALMAADCGSAIFSIFTCTRRVVRCFALYSSPTATPRPYRILQNSEPGLVRSP